MTVEANKILNQTLKEIYSKNIKDIRISIDVNPNNMSWLIWKILVKSKNKFEIILI